MKRIQPNAYKALVFLILTCGFHRWFQEKAQGLFVLGASQGRIHPELEPDVGTKFAPLKILDSDNVDVKSTSILC